MEAVVEGKEDLCDETEYRLIVGKLLYAVHTVRFDIAYIVTETFQISYLAKEQTFGDSEFCVALSCRIAEHGIVFRVRNKTSLVYCCDAGCNLVTELECKSKTGAILEYGVPRLVGDQSYR